MNLEVMKRALELLAAIDYLAIDDSLHSKSKQLNPIIKKSFDHLSAGDQIIVYVSEWFTCEEPN